MSSSQSRPIHQDFIARIRYSNALPPPPNPPKLLDIPNTGLASGQYTTPGFASRLAREQPLNIEVDAELGMPLDLVGMPGVFDGDESSIQPPAQQPNIHPKDRALLRPLAALGKTKVADTGVSFLRRTEYISAVGAKHSQVNLARGTVKNRMPRARRPEAASDAPESIKRKIDKSFELAEQYLKDPKRIKHPSKRNLTLVDARPLLPDPDSLPDSGTFATVKFLVNPVQSGSKYDATLETGMFRPVEKTPEQQAALQAAQLAHEADPVNNPKPSMPEEYEYFLAKSLATSKNYRRMMDPEDPEHDNEDLYTDRDEGQGVFSFKKQRGYETKEEIDMGYEKSYSVEVLLSNNDNENYPKQKAVYYYPISQKSVIRPQRTRNIARTIGIEDEPKVIVDQLDVKVVNPSEDYLAKVRHFKTHPTEQYPEPAEEEEEQQQQQQLEEEVVEEERASRSASEDRDADGDDEE